MSRENFLMLQTYAKRIYFLKCDQSMPEVNNFEICDKSVKKEHFFFEICDQSMSRDACQEITVKILL